MSENHDLIWGIFTEMEEQGYWRNEISNEGLRILADSGASLVIKSTGLTMVEPTLTPEHERSLNMADTLTIEHVKGLGDEPAQ